MLSGKELYCYKNKSDGNHKEMKTLTGVFIKDQEDSLDEASK